MPPKDAVATELFMKNPTTGEMVKVTVAKDFQLEVADDRINDDVIYPKENRWFPFGGTISVKPTIIIDGSAREV